MFIFFHLFRAFPSFLLSISLFLFLMCHEFDGICTVFAWRISSLYTWLDFSPITNSILYLHIRRSLLEGKAPFVKILETRE